MFKTQLNLGVLTQLCKLSKFQESAVQYCVYGQQYHMVHFKIFHITYFILRVLTTIKTLRNKIFKKLKFIKNKKVNGSKYIGEDQNCYSTELPVNLLFFHFLILPARESKATQNLVLCTVVQGVEKRDLMVREQGKPSPFFWSQIFQPESQKVSGQSQRQK